MTVAYSTVLAEHRPEKLPSFRELLPDHLHDEIEGGVFYAQSNQHWRGGSLHDAMPPPTQQAERLPSRLFARDSRFDDVSLRPDRFSGNSAKSLENQQSHISESKSTTPASHSRPKLTLTEINRSLPPPIPSPSREYFVKVSPNANSTTIYAPLNSRGRADGELSNYSISSPRSQFSFDSSSLSHSSSPVNMMPPCDCRDPLSYSPYEHAHACDRGYPQSSFGHYRPASAFCLSECDLGDMREKKRRGNLPKPVTDMLRAWLWEHLDHPYPTEEDKQIFMSRTGLTINQISNWFINARRRQVASLRSQVKARNNSESDSNSSRRNSSPRQSDDESDYLPTPSEKHSSLP
ncbi:AhpA [Arthroderma uncinatum]|uniref:AhpA n=1 Tax=Arthroderma uncinatum TaxID=74035 RepID=UPI00144A6C9F|nr:AhpA [Arthroderma uncinatum]KAF3483641.1 AhpA [Arthroderma uncinatum]